MFSLNTLALAFVASECFLILNGFVLDNVLSPHLVVLADRDGTLYLWCSSKVMLSRRLCDLGDYRVAAKPPSGRIALHSECFLT